MPKANKSPFTTLKTVKTYVSPPNTTPIGRYPAKQRSPPENREGTPPPLMLKAHPSRQLSTLKEPSCASNPINSERVNQRSFKSILLQPSALGIKEQTATSQIHQSHTELVSKRKDREAHSPPHYETRKSHNSSFIPSLATEDTSQCHAVENKMEPDEAELFKDHIYVDIDELTLNLHENVINKPQETDPTLMVSEPLENNYFILKLQQDNEKENRFEERHYFTIEEAVANEQEDFESSKSLTSCHFYGMDKNKKEFPTLHSKTKTSPLLHSNTVDGSMRVPPCDYEVPIRCLQHNDDFSLPTRKGYQRSHTLPAQKGASVAPTNWTSHTPSPHTASPSPSPSQRSPCSSPTMSSLHNTTMFSYEDNVPLSLSSENFKTDTKSYQTKSPFVSPERSPPNAFVLKIPEDDENKVRYCTQDRNYFKLEEIESDSNEEDDEGSQTNPYSYIDVNRKEQMLLALINRRSHSLPREITPDTSYRQRSLETSQIDYEEPIFTLRRNCGQLSSSTDSKKYHSFTPKRMGVASSTTPPTNLSFSPSQSSPSPFPNQTSVYSFANKYDEACSNSSLSLPSSLFSHDHSLLHQPKCKMSDNEQLRIQRSQSPTSSISSPLQSPSSPLSGCGSQTTFPLHDNSMLLHESSRHCSLPVITMEDGNDDSHLTSVNPLPNVARRSTLPNLLSRSPSPVVCDHFVNLLITEDGPVLLPK